MPSAYLTDADLFAAAAPFRYRTEFAKALPNIYATARRRNLVDAVCAHMERAYKDWTDLSVCLTEARQFTTRNEFRVARTAAYEAIARAKAQDTAYQHMTSRKHTHASVKALAASYTSLAASIRVHSGAYSWAVDNKCTDALFWHMKAKGGFALGAPAILYVASIQHPVYPDLVKIGISNRTFQQRYAAEATSMALIAQWQFDVGLDAWQGERSLKGQLRAQRWHGDRVLSTTGNTEVYTMDALPLILQMIEAA